MLVTSQSLAGLELRSRAFVGVCYALAKPGWGGTQMGRPEVEDNSDNRRTMSRNQIVRFGKFELDVRAGELRKYGLRIRLQDQPLRILLMLLEHPGEVVSREQIRRTLWPDGTIVEFDHSINAAIKRLRDRFGESAEQPRYVETLARRGYRFIAEVSEPAPIPAPAPRLNTVGRAREREQLREALTSASAGHGHMLCVSGEPGIGKTTLVEEFLREVGDSHNCRIGRALCSERLAGTEAWLPWLEALESLLAGASNTEPTVRSALKEIAPVWSLLLRPAISQTSGASTDIPSQERLKREMWALVRHLSQLQPLVLFLDDLHWADASSTDLLIHLVHRFDSVRALIIVSFRPSDLVLSGHPFLEAKLDLEAHGRCREIALGFLSREEIQAYMALEFPRHRFPPELLDMIHQKTEGNPLFMADLLRELSKVGIIKQAEGGWALARSVEGIAENVPASIRGVIQRKIRRLGHDTALLLAASVQGYEFDSAVVAEVLGIDSGDVEERLDELQRVHEFVRCVSENDLPDGTPSLRYRFVHVLYQNTLYASLRPTRRGALSRAVAEVLLAHYGDRAAEISSEVAVLFEVARKPASAAKYFRLACERAVSSGANREAVALGRRGVESVKSLPGSLERDQIELSFYTTYGPALIATSGFSSAETARIYARAHELCQTCGSIEQSFTVAWGLSCVYHVGGVAREGLEMAEEMLRLAEQANDKGLLVAAHYALGDTLFWHPRYQESLHHLGQAVALYDPREHHTVGLRYIGYDPAVTSVAFQAWNLWYLGCPDQAVEKIAEARAIARPLNSRVSVTTIDVSAAAIHNLRGEPKQALECAERGVAVCREEGFEFFLVHHLVEAGWATALQGRMAEGIAQIREAIALHESMGARLERPLFLAALAESLSQAGRLDEALVAAQDGLDRSRFTALRFHEPELLRLKAELLAEMSVSNFEQAEACLREALKITRETGAKSLQLRAALSLCRLQRRRGKHEERDMLASLIAQFSEGSALKDFKESMSLLQS
jgi:DNA-binding winged helix-turn-helix (wHTH) protein/tetratricopeptide (TPR) repeat protein